MPNLECLVTVAQSLTALVPGQLLGSCFLEYQWRMTKKLNWRKNIVAVITRVDGNLKNQIKNRTLHASRLFLPTKIFQYTSNWSKASWAFTHSLIRYTRVVNKFHYAGFYIKRTNASLFLIRDTLPTLNLPIKSHQSST